MVYESDLLNFWTMSITSHKKHNVLKLDLFLSSIAGVGRLDRTQSSVLIHSASSIQSKISGILNHKSSPCHLFYHLHANLDARNPTPNLIWATWAYRSST